MESKVFIHYGDNYRKTNEIIKDSCIGCAFQHNYDSCKLFRSENSCDGLILVKENDNSVIEEVKK